MHSLLPMLKADRCVVWHAAFKQAHRAACSGAVTYRMPPQVACWPTLGSCWRSCLQVPHKVVQCSQLQLLGGCGGHCECFQRRHGDCTEPGVPVHRHCSQLRSFCSTLRTQPLQSGLTTFEWSQLQLPS